MFKGSELIGGEPLQPGEFSQRVRAMGGNDNAFTSKDYTAYFQSVPVSQLETVIRMEAGRMKSILGRELVSLADGITKMLHEE
jgi:zinc protease